MDTVAEQPEQRLLHTTAGAMHQLSIGRTSLYGLFASGELTPIKIGSRTFVSQANINDYVGRLTEAAAQK